MITKAYLLCWICSLDNNWAFIGDFSADFIFILVVSIWEKSLMIFFDDCSLYMRWYILHRVVKFCHFINTIFLLTYFFSIWKCVNLSELVIIYFNFLRNDSYDLSSIFHLSSYLILSLTNRCKRRRYYLYLVLE